MKVTETIADRKLELAQWLLSLDDEVMIAQIESLMKTALSEYDWFDELSDAEKTELDEAEADIAAGRVLTHAQVMENIKACLKK